MHPWMNVNDDCSETGEGISEKSIFENNVNTYLAISDNSISPSSFLSKDSSYRQENFH